MFARPGSATAAAYLQALLDVVDLHDFDDGCPAGIQLDADYGELAGRPGIRAVTGMAS